MHTGFNNKGIQLSDTKGSVQMVWGLVQSFNNLLKDPDSFCLSLLLSSVKQPASFVSKNSHLLVSQTNPGKMWEGCEYGRRNGVTSENLVKRLWLPPGVHTHSLSLPCTSHSGKRKLLSCEQCSEETQVVKLSINSQLRSGAY